MVCPFFGVLSGWPALFQSFSHTICDHLACLSNPGNGFHASLRGLSSFLCVASSVYREFCNETTDSNLTVFKNVGSLLKSIWNSRQILYSDSLDLLASMLELSQQICRTVSFASCSSEYSIVNFVFISLSLWSFFMVNLAAAVPPRPTSLTDSQGSLLKSSWRSGV